MERALTEQERTELRDLLIQLIAIPSVSTALEQSEPPEEALAGFISDYLRKIGMAVEYVRMDNGRPNLIGCWKSDKNKPKLVLTAHMDTVDVKDMTVDPFRATIHNGKITGRGACDTKGSLAVYLWILKQIEDRRERFNHAVEFVGTCQEEDGCLGATWLADRGYLKANHVIVGEPTQCRAATAHRGSAVLELTAHGRSCHASVPEVGDNAIYRMNDLIKHLRSHWLPTVFERTHPLLGSATAAVTMIEGGVRFNMIPDICRATVDLRILPGQTRQDVLQELEQVLETMPNRATFRYDIHCPFYQAPMDTDPDLPFVRELLEACNQDQPTGVPYFADSSHFARTGAQCVLFGPGDIAQAHSADEYLELDQLYRAAEVLLRFFQQKDNR